jgi:peptidoglycan/xylan/chitin deacetylase (PgdA/CDA1 family)
MSAGSVGIPILMYHAITDRGSDWIGDFAVPPSRFAQHLDQLVQAGCTGLTVTELVEAVNGGGRLPPRPVVITFDDGFADLHQRALPLLRERGLPATVYVTTGFVEGDQATRSRRRPPDRMLSWSQLAELLEQGVEVGGHTHSHPELDAVPRRVARQEIATCRRLIEDRLGVSPDSFTYPYGYSTGWVRDAVAALGFSSACAVKHALSSAADDRLALARLEVKADTSAARLAAWLRGDGVRVAPCGERLRTRAWRVPRRVRAAPRWLRAAGPAGALP